MADPVESDNQAAEPAVDNPMNYSQTPVKEKVSLRGRFKRRRQKLTAGLLAIVLAFAMGGIGLHLLSGSLKLPHLDAHLDKRAARYGYVAAKRSAMLTTEKIAVAANQDSLALAMAKRTILGRSLDRLDPQRVVTKAKARGVIEIDKTPGFFGGRVTEVRVNGNPHVKPRFSLTSPVESTKAKFNWTSDIFHSWNDTLGQSVSRSVRTRSGKALINEVGGKLLWWPFRARDERGKTPAEAMRDEETRRYKNIDEKGNKGGRIDREEEAKNKANQALDQCTTNPKCEDSLIKGQKKPFELDSVQSPIKKWVTDLKNAPKLYPPILSGLVSLTVIACVINETATDTSKAVVAANEAESIKSYLAIKDPSSQQKQGDTVGEAVGGVNDLTGDITQTNPEKLARDEPIDTTAEPFAQATRARDYHYKDIMTAILYPFLPLCPYIFQPAVMIGLMITFLVPPLLAIENPEGSPPIVPGPEYPAAVVASKVAQSALEKILSNTIVKALQAKLSQLTLRSLVSSGLKFGLGYEAFNQSLSVLERLERMIIISEMGGLITGLDPKTFVNEADMGAVAYNNELDRTHNFGRPLKFPEVKKAEIKAVAYWDNQEAHSSVFHRYFALTNPKSKLSEAVMAGDGFVTHPSRLGHALGAIPRFFGGLFHGKPAEAASTNQTKVDPNTDTENYNLMQWGWSTDEEDRLDTDPTYDMLINSEILKDSGQEGAIEAKFGACYEKPIEDLVTNKTYVKRDTTTGTPIGGLCSAEKLGYGNTEFDNVLCGGDKLLQKTGLRIKTCDHLVFRWRVDHSLRTNLTDITDYENASGPAEGTATGTGSAPAQLTSGGLGINSSSATLQAFPLRTTAAAIEAAGWCYTSQSSCHHDYNAADIFAPTGTPVVSPGDCIAVTVHDSTQFPSAEGSRVSLHCGDRIYYMAHMGRGSLVVTEGQHLKPGDAIGSVGTSADAEGANPHLHIDALPASQYSTRPNCKDADCKQFPFINIQPDLVAAFGKLP